MTYLIEFKMDLEKKLDSIIAEKIMLEDALKVLEAMKRPKTIKHELIKILCKQNSGLTIKEINQQMPENFKKTSIPVILSRMKKDKKVTNNKKKWFLVETL